MHTFGINMHFSSQELFFKLYLMHALHAAGSALPGKSLLAL